MASCASVMLLTWYCASAVLTSVSIWGARQGVLDAGRLPEVEVQARPRVPAGRVLEGGCSGRAVEDRLMAELEVVPHGHRRQPNRDVEVEVVAGAVRCLEVLHLGPLVLERPVAAVVVYAHDEVHVRSGNRPQVYRVVPVQPSESRLGESDALLAADHGRHDEVRDACAVQGRDVAVVVGVRRRARDRGGGRLIGDGELAVLRVAERGARRVVVDDRGGLVARRVPAREGERVRRGIERYP